MMKQTSLFADIIAPRALARRTHPETSKSAARAIIPKLGALQAEVLARISRSPGKTVSELARIYEERDPRRIGRRINELVVAGKVDRAGVRRCTITQRPAETWRAR